ncbi:zinc finger protein 699-like isoform X1 [Micropterus salmoides]|uniref:zinc finger protein 699-like isoform X1 n=2 Tax=Micropterus salmoides TaxID=27706 RepID=UPI0018EA5E30|nr:zinc finger protein 699-like isoform X1 [Micropterus salmoides]
MNRMDEDNITFSKGNCGPLPLSTLQLLVPPIRLLSAAIWQTLEQKAVADYGMLEEFVSMVTDIVPELLTACQRAQLILGLRARLILELCQFEATAEVVQPHLDRVQMLIKAWEAGAANMEHVEAPHSKFVDLVKNLLNNPDERHHFFQNVFPEEFGPTYDEALQTLMWMFLSRLEKFLPLQSFQQVASMFSETSSVLADYMDCVSRREELRTLLQYQKDLSQLDHNDGSLDGACIISALKLPSIEGPDTDNTQPRANILDNGLSCASHLESLTLPHTTQIKTDTHELKVDETDWSPWENGTAELSGDMTRHKENVGRPQSQVEDASRLIKQCCVQLKRLDMPLSLRSRPVRQNRGLRMKEILLEEKRGLREETLPAYKSASRTRKDSDRALSDDSDDDCSSSFSKDSYMAPVNDCSEDDSWSYYSNEDSCRNTSPSVADSWSDYSDDERSFVAPVSSYTRDDSLSSCSDEDPSFVGPQMFSDRKQGTSDIKASTSKKTRKVQCFFCKEHLSTSLRTHMKTHFPTSEYACPRCDTRFKFISSFRLHMSRTCFEYSTQQVDPEKPEEAKSLYKCDQCDEAFRYKVSLRMHKLTHNELYCGVCRKVLRDAATLARHKASHTLFQCNRCEQSFPLFKPLLSHYKNVHKISRPFKCNHCPRTLSRLRIFIAHEWKHTGRMPFQCAHCGLRFNTDSDLLSHERVHTGEKPYLCAECGRTFAQKSNLMRHFNFLHSESRNEKKHSCSECGKSFKEKGALRKHQRKNHLRELFRHPCSYCGKMMSASALARHNLIHSGERPFKCTVPECDRYFRSTSEVKRHVLIHHTTERPYKCNVCGKGFVKMCYLNVHAKIHSGEKPFVCHICGKAFPKIYSMHRHKKLVHTFVTH